MKKLLGFCIYALLVAYVTLEIVHQASAGIPEQPVREAVPFNPESLYVPDYYEKDHPEVQCLAENLFHEARGEGVEGKLAVAFVTMNRVRHANYGDTVCEVVHEPYQFSWVHQGMDINLDNPIERRSWEMSQKIAQEVLNRKHINDMLGVTHYHATSVNPEWGKREVAQVGNHIFYGE